MGIFTRLRDIVSSNINAMLEKAEDPEKLIKLMIQEMEDTLVEIKASCAGTMATRKKIERELEAAGQNVTLWSERAELALSKGCEGLTREALLRKRQCTDRVDALEREAAECQELIEQHRRDIDQLEDKLSSAREKHRVLVRRHIHAQRKRQAQQGIRRADTSDAWVRFEQFEGRIERMEAAAELVNDSRRGSALDEAFAELTGDEDIERELEEMKQRAGGKPHAGE